MKANIFNIQKFSLNDGPGMRTTIFFKGCPLRCWWCHNPESQCNNSELIFWKDRCISCGTCDEIREKNGDEKRLADACPANALELVGEVYSVEELVEELLKDKVFYDQSKGGITFSGGEPLMHIDFIVQVGKVLKERGIHMALDTSGYGKWEDIEKSLDVIDLYLYDIKHLNSEIHRQMTGVPNELILDNLMRLAKQNKAIIIRVPIIPMVNNGLAYIKELSLWLQEAHLTEVNILPYHDIAIDKYERLGKTYEHKCVKTPSNSEMEVIKETMEAYGLKIMIGG